MNASAAGPVVLGLVGITRRYGKLLALDHATLELRAGTVHALLGENGAGKTTLMHIAFGLVRADSGSIHHHGVAVRVASPAVALAAGIGMVHQHFTLVPGMTVAENVALGGHGLFDRDAAAARVQEATHRIGLALDPHALVSTLGVSAQQRCEIVKALARNVSVLIMDEPTAVLAPRESQELLSWLRRFADEGHAVVLITHKLRDALAVADDVTVLHRGRTVLSAPVGDVTESSLAAAMLGDDAQAGVAVDGHGDAVPDAGGSERAAPRSVDPLPVLRAEGISVQDERGVVRLRDGTVRVMAGEIVGIAAVEGAGHRELLRALAGRCRVLRGVLSAPRDVGFVPEDRHRDALMLDASLVDNIALRGAGDRQGVMPWRRIRALTDRIIATHDVRTTGGDSTVRALSGGNQQKLVLGRELANQPAALVVENPTRGLDFRATHAVHAALLRARREGTAIVLYSSDIDEVLALADRTYVVHEGSVREVSGDRDVVGRAMLGTD